MAVAVDPDDEDETMDVLEANFEAVKTFLAAGTQWRVSIVAGLSGVVPFLHGLDYAGLDALMRRRRIRDPQVFEDVRTMEQAALAAFNGLEAETGA